MQGPSSGTICKHLQDRRVLVVEDEALVAMLIEDTLLDAGAQVLGPAADLENALQYVRDAALGALDLAVVDLNLNGTLAHPVAAALAERRIPFLVTTGYSPDDLCGEFDAPILCKPFDGMHLIKALIDMLPARAAPPGTPAF